MIESTETRELFVLEDGGLLVRGTCHRPLEHTSTSHKTASRSTRVGAVILNSMSPTRAGNGDAAAALADVVAQHGVACFRLDLPGFGDSDGEPPPRLLEFINSGRYGRIASQKVRELARRFDLSGVILIGHCAGAVTAIYTAAEVSGCCGLILLAPYFHLPHEHKTQLGHRLNLWSRRSRIGDYLSTVYDGIKAIRLAFHRNRPPADANYELLRCWKQLASAGLPILYIMAPARKTAGPKPRLGEFDYLQHVLRLAGQKGRVQVAFAEGADHSFANRAGRATVHQLIRHWLPAHFPLVNNQHGLTRVAEPILVSRNLPAGSFSRSATQS